MKRKCLFFAVLAAVLFVVKPLLAGVVDSTKVRYAFLTDIHVSPGKDSEETLRRIVDEVNKGDFDFVILTGDLTNVGSDAELLAVKAVLSGLKIPCHVISGNHENTWSESVCQTFKSIFGDDHFVFDYGKYRFLGIPTGPYMKMGNGHTKEEDVEWLEKITDTPESKRKTLVFAAHYPLMDGLDNWYKITDVLNKSKVAFAMCGHGHTLSMHNFDGIPGIMGRATFTRTGPRTGGYNIIELANDSVYVFEKLVDSVAPKLFTQFSMEGNEEVLKSLPVSQRPDYSINGKSSLMKNATMIENHSSVFTGVTCLDENTLVYACSDGKIKLWNVSDSRHPEMVWEKQVNEPVYSTPLKAGNAVIIGTIDGSLTAYNFKSGAVKWQAELGKPISSNGKVMGKYVYIGAGSDFYKINVETGEVSWKYAAGGRLQAEPLVLSDKVIFGAWDTYLYCVNKADGTLCWKWTNGSSQILYSPGNVIPVADKKTVFIVAPDRFMTAIDLKTGQTLWRDNRFKVRESIGISNDHKIVYAKTMNDTIIAVKANRSKLDLDYALNVGYGYEHSPSPILERNGSIYLGTCEGSVISVSKKTRAVEWKVKCGNSGVNNIAFSDNGYLLVSLVEGKIMIFLKRNFF